MPGSNRNLAVAATASKPPGSAQIQNTHTHSQSPLLCKMHFQLSSCCSQMGLCCDVSVTEGKHISSNLSLRIFIKVAARGVFAEVLNPPPIPPVILT